MPDTDKPSTLIVGLGKTGLSCARFFRSKGLSFSVIDSRANPPGLDLLKRIDPDAPIHTGGFDEKYLQGIERIILSPGVALSEPFLQQASADGIDIIGDIELFAQNADAPVIAIAGSNGKSTVTTLVGDMLAQSGLRVSVGGNLGLPAMDLLTGNDESENHAAGIESDVDCYVLELSSFQLETTKTLNASAAVVLNVSPDHMDRYTSFAGYARAKQQVYHGDGIMVVNEDDEDVMAMCRDEQSRARAESTVREIIGFTLGEPDKNGFGILNVADHGGVETKWLARGAELLLPIDKLRIAGRHNFANALAALALVDAMQLPMSDMLDALQAFAGLPHRMQWVAEINDVNWYNDSKGTNVGATVSAIEGMSGRKILIAGGDGKQADFMPLQAAVKNNNVVEVVLIGKDKNLIADALADSVKISYAETLGLAVETAGQHAISGDSVMLSPACASFDMFDSYEHRGQVFIDAVLAREGRQNQ